LERYFYWPSIRSYAYLKYATKSLWRHLIGEEYNEAIIKDLIIKGYHKKAEWLNDDQDYAQFPPWVLKKYELLQVITTF